MTRPDLTAQPFGLDDDSIDALFQNTFHASAGEGAA